MRDDLYHTIKNAIINRKAYEMKETVNYYYVALKDKLHKVNMEVEVFFSLTKGWVLNKYEATPMHTKEDAEGMIKLLVRSGDISTNPNTEDKVYVVSTMDESVITRPGTIY